MKGNSFDFIRVQDIGAIPVLDPETDIFDLGSFQNAFNVGPTRTCTRFKKYPCQEEA